PSTVTRISHSSENIRCCHFAPDRQNLLPSPRRSHHARGAWVRLRAVTDPIASGVQSSIRRALDLSITRLSCQNRDADPGYKLLEPDIATIGVLAIHLAADNVAGLERLDPNIPELSAFGIPQLVSHGRLSDLDKLLLGILLEKRFPHVGQPANDLH